MQESDKESGDSILSIFVDAESGGKNPDKKENGGGKKSLLNTIQLNHRPAPDPDDEKVKKSFWEHRKSPSLPCASKLVLTFLWHWFGEQSIFHLGYVSSPWHALAQSMLVFMAIMLINR
ncbi:hypothetical protein CEXT_408871 [Caerostris extrusa]|uniref:Uncharacterized protein n=1 Tax=Caerostris extrusa TaxID=172846 RepID=A0AAV4QGB1_CAEEX|nr:hypothetical protein CEXT_408871 [Caerostris extrusa]